MDSINSSKTSFKTLLIKSCLFASDLYYCIIDIVFGLVLFVFTFLVFIVLDSARASRTFIMLPNILMFIIIIIITTAIIAIITIFIITIISSSSSSSSSSI